MMTLRLGAAGGQAAALAMAAYLQEKQLADETMRAASYYCRTAGAEEAITAGHGCAALPRADMAPEVARALGLDPARPLSTDQLANLLAGSRADGAELDGQGRGVGTYKASAEGGAGQDRHEVAYLDLTLSASKGVSVRWALAKTEAERAAFLQAHRTAVAETLRYVEDQVGWARTGSGGQGRRERARLGWVSCDHYTARPTLECVRTDPDTGEQYTELRSVPVTGDPQLHTHSIVPNVMVTESGRTVALDTRLFHGRIHEFGAVYQALLGRELRAMGVAVELDERTNMARLPSVPQWVCDEFSKRTRDAETAAKERAAERGVDYDALDGDGRAAFLAYGARATRRDKESNKPDLDAWRAQAERIGWTPGDDADTPPPLSRAERMAAADRAALPHLAEMLSKRAVIGQGDVRLAAARGFIAAGIEGTGDLDAMMREWASGGVEQDGQWTRLVWQHAERGQVKLTTELHRDQEAELVRLASDAAADRAHALAPEEVAASISGSGVSYAGEHGEAQRRAVERLGTDGSLAVLVGTAGSGKTTRVLPPLVAAWEARGMEVWGAAQAWRQANALQEAGIAPARTRALQPLLDGIEAGETRIRRDAVVVVDELGQIGTRQLLQLLRLRERHGFKVVAAGDDRQCAAIEAGPVIDLLRRALGEERVPEILSTVRQQTEEERRIAGLFREGKAAEALAVKRERGTAELVPGGYRAAVERVADLYAEQRRAAPADWRITISAPTNADAREIGRAVRERRREMGEVTGPDLRLSATDGRGDAYALDLAAGDNVRLFSRTRGVAVCADGRRRGVMVGDNGSVVRVLAVARAEGLTVRTDTGVEAFVPWANLRDRHTGRVVLAHGDCLTIDSSQGITSDVHINALPAGSRSAPAGKSYVAESRHRVRSHLVGSMGAELREVAERRAAGLPVLAPGEAERAAWANVARNMKRDSAKDSALAFLERGERAKRETVRVFQAGMRRVEARRAEGQAVVVLREKARVRAVRAALPALAEGVRQSAGTRAEVAESLRAMGAYWEDRTARRVAVAARMVDAGTVTYGEAVARVVSAESADQRRGAPLDPVHGLPRLMPGSEGVEEMERRVQARMAEALDALAERHAARVAEVAARGARQSSGLTA